MYKKILSSVLIGCCFLANSALAALPKEGIYEKHSNNGTLEARMFVLGENGATAHTFGYGNETSQIIWVESYLSNGEKHAEFATKYIWKTDNAGAAETALVLDREQLGLLNSGEIATPSYAQDMAVFSFTDNGTARVGVTTDFTGVPASWNNGKVAASFSGNYDYITNDLKFTPLSLAYVMEATGNPNRLLNAHKVNAEWNQSKLRIRKAGNDYEFVENLMEQGYLVKMKASFGNTVRMNCQTGRGVLTGSEVRLRRNTTTNSQIIGVLDLNESVNVLGFEQGLDGRGWYYIERQDGKEGFAAAQFIDLR